MVEAGLIVGKFSPLHRGHEHLIRQAQQQCRRLYLLCYSLPEMPGCPASLREKWLRERFAELPGWVITPERVATWRAAGKALPELPENDSAEGLHRQFVADFCREVIGETVQAVFTSEDYGDGFAAHLAASFGHPVRHVSVDRLRMTVPVSGTALRGDVHALRDFLAPSVYADFVERVVFLGGESTGKSTLSQRLAQVTGTQCVAEYGRELWEEKGGALVYDDLLHIAETQVARETEACAKASRYLFCDTSPLTTLLYCQSMFGRAEEALQRLAERPYARVFLCADDFPFVQDGTRREEDFRRWQQAWYVAELQRRGIEYQLLSGTLEQRTEQVLRALGWQP
jgi:NadR type nicotinamide-nucleotide adenylyltransferase